jgi:hypothetical protein
LPLLVLFNARIAYGGKKPDKYLPALKKLLPKVSIKDVSNEVESVYVNEPVLSRSVKMFFCKRMTGEKLKDIGSYFDVGESGVSQASRRVHDKMTKDKKFKKKNRPNRKAIAAVKNDDLTPTYKNPE